MSPSPFKFAWWLLAWTKGGLHAASGHIYAKTTTNLALARDTNTTYRVLVSSTAVLTRIEKYSQTAQEEL